MGTKEALLSLFERNKGSFYSGEDLAERLGISRTAVWKGMNALRKDGYMIEAVQGKGYCMSEDTDIISKTGIENYLGDSSLGLEINVFQEIDSTNSYLKDQANSGAKEGMCAIAASQTMGRGRKGRSFYSPSDTGLYMSILLRPENLSVSEATRITTMAAVAACRSISNIMGSTPGIKWVNDIFIAGRKVGGILTEASLDMENNRLDYVVMGIGFNVYKPREGFPPDIMSTAGYIMKNKLQDGKNRLAAEFLKQFMGMYLRFEDNSYTEEYRRLSIAVGKKIYVLCPDGKRSATALDVDGDCRLLVRYEDGSEEYLSSGEISIRIV